VVAIAAELGLTIPKTSSRAITSAAGTADTMAMLAPVELDEAQIRHVVETCGGCIAWGGAMNLAPCTDGGGCLRDGLCSDRRTVSGKRGACLTCASGSTYRRRQMTLAS
jgi:thymidine phosphorylase